DALERIAARAEALEQLRRQHLELVRPHARRDAHDEDAALDRSGTRAIRDARTHGRAPLRDRDRRTSLREAILACAIEDLLDRLGRSETHASFRSSRARHRGRW